MTKSEQYIETIRTRDGLKRAIIQSIEVDKRNKKIVFHLVTDLPYSEEDVSFTLKTTLDYLPEGFEGDITLKKLVAAEDLVARKTKELLDRFHPAASAFIREEDVEIERGDGFVKVGFGLSGEEKGIVGKEVLESVAEHLSRSFCGAFYVSAFKKEKEALVFEEEPEEEEFRPGCRYFEIAEFEPLEGIDEIPKYATYMADGVTTEGDMTFCGQITYIEEKETQKGKPFFRFTVTDGTGIVKVVYFTKKATLEKIRELKAGDSIVCTGTNENYNGSLSFKVKKINFGRVPEGFVPEKRPCRSVPKQYHTVFPEEILDYSQGDMFGQAPLPEAFLRRDYVVFDLETTGLNNNPAMGTMDRIIEIGAVKIRGGEIKEKFSSFVACPSRLSKEIIALTGIDDEMLVGAPEVGDVLLDFYKFADGCELVGHNVMFDYKFISYYGEQADIRFDALIHDTVRLAQENLALANYKLNTVAEKFKITFNHHRAYDDALTTAKIFIELIRLKKCLPNEK
ncbi:MAG: hypothetical protein J5993_04575 [Clostridia bacterium]|nr:hypothetical protein [Clostridia bacterium]